MIGGLSAFLYVAALLYGAPAVFRRCTSIADHLRCALILGIAIPAVLGAVHLLYAPLLWICVLALCAWRTIVLKPALGPQDPIQFATLAGCLLVLWPPLSRPLLDGDSLLYHLPNAAAFVQSHSIWSARAPYWIYPPASELFTAGLFAAAGRWALPLAGALAALLLAARLYERARESGAPAYACGATAIAFICTPVAAFQSGTLQNDLWLAAFVVEVLSLADASWISLAVCALLKPFGWIVGLIGAVAARVRLRDVLLSFVPLALWIVRDEILLSRGQSAGFSVPDYFANAIAPNLTAAVPQLVHGIATVTPQSFAWIAMLACGAFFGSTRRYAAAGAAMLVLYLFLPQSYRNGATNYVLDASSWRYALPALACGALAAAALAKRFGAVGAIAGYALAIWGAWSVLAIFWNDAYTHYALLAAAIALAAAAAAAKTHGFSVAAIALAVLLAGSWCASTRVQGFFGDWMRQPSGKPTAVFAWLAAHQPRAVVAVNVRAGAVILSSPRTMAFSLDSEQSGCALAAREGAVLLVGTNEERADANVMREFDAAKRCGAVLYEDGAGVLVKPASD